MQTRTFTKMIMNIYKHLASSKVIAVKQCEIGFQMCLTD